MRLTIALCKPLRWAGLCMTASLIGCAPATTNQAHQPVPAIPAYAPQSIRNLPITGFDPAVAADALEMCLDLDSQDDLNAYVQAHPGIAQEASEYYPRVSSKWIKIYDSRFAVGAQNHVSVSDPVSNGFGPFDNAWTLWRSAGTHAGPPTYVIAIRGTVVHDNKTVLEDLVTTTIPARYGIKRGDGILPLSFSDFPRAEVHAGFAYGTVSLLLDKDFGVLSKLAELKRNGQLPGGSRVIITGHSQGAAMAALTHAFFYTAVHDGQFQSTLAGLKLTSYMFAQPKPGNHQFGEDFAIFATLRGESFVLNNSLDPVTRVPLTIEVPLDADADMDAHSQLSDSLQRLNVLPTKIHAFFSNRANSRIATFVQGNNDALIEDPACIPLTDQPRGSAVSLDFVTVGLLIPLVGQGDAKSSDDFLQHHAVTYRKLYAETFGMTSTAAIHN
jgi:hypothetical protein